MAKTSKPTPADKDKTYDDYRRLKRWVIAQEKTNNSKIIIFPSSNTPNQKIEWMRVGGVSALIYKYYIAPRLGKRPPKILPDKDFGPKFPDGTISIRDKDALVKKLSGLGYTIKTNDKIITAEIKTFTKDELKELKNRTKTDRERANALIKPAELCPEIYTNLVNLARALSNKTSHKRDKHPELVADISNTATNLLKVYVNLANGNVSKDEGTKKLKTGINNLCATLIVANELDFFDFKTSVRLGETIVKIKDNLKEN